MLVPELYSQGIYRKTRPLANLTTYKSHIIARRRFSLIKTAESCKQLLSLLRSEAFTNPNSVKVITNKTR